MEDNKIPLAEMIQTLREELEKAQAQGATSKLKFALDSVELELSVAVSKTGTGKGGIKFWVVEAGAEYKAENVATHKFTLKLKSGSPGEILISSESAGKMSDD